MGVILGLSQAANHISYALAATHRELLRRTFCGLRGLRELDRVVIFLLLTSPPEFFRLVFVVLFCVFLLPASLLRYS